ncbi:hypothetical protein C8R46DRAFT_1275546 [Mycena filopes]|nr:hypothetical protein C8R46DRAFT_1275546 [Mycena filopes]
MPAVLSHLRTPVIERLGFRGAIEADWLPADFDAYLVSLAPDDSTFFAGFKSLTELLLPCDGLSARSLEILPDLLAQAPVLQHLYFARPRAATKMTVDLPGAAARYLEAITSLKSVSWEGHTRFDVVRAGAGGEVQGPYPYVAPRWKGWGGIGGWWEV